jgi:hypothetical protein
MVKANALLLAIAYLKMSYFEKQKKWSRQTDSHNQTIEI